MLAIQLPPTPFSPLAPCAAPTLDLPSCQPWSPSTALSTPRTYSRSSAAAAASRPSIQKWSMKSRKGSLVG
jgi:hypothetical protein